MGDVYLFKSLTLQANPLRLGPRERVRKPGVPVLNGMMTFVIKPVASGMSALSVVGLIEDLCVPQIQRDSGNSELILIFAYT